MTNGRRLGLPKVVNNDQRGFHFAPLRASQHRENITVARAISRQLDEIAENVMSPGGSALPAGNECVSQGGRNTFSSTALKVLEARYLRREAREAVSETPDQLFVRVSSAIAEAERKWGRPGRQPGMGGKIS